LAIGQLGCNSHSEGSFGTAIAVDGAEISAVPEYIF
jgi:hypothetical protein